MTASWCTTFWVLDIRSTARRRSEHRAARVHVESSGVWPAPTFTHYFHRRRRTNAFPVRCKFTGEIGRRWNRLTIPRETLELCFVRAVVTRRRCRAAFCAFASHARRMRVATRERDFRVVGSALTSRVPLYAPHSAGIRVRHFEPYIPRELQTSRNISSRDVKPFLSPGAERRSRGRRLSNKKGAMADGRE